MKVDQEDNVYCTGPGGIHVMDKSGKLLGRLLIAGHCTNIAWGDDDWRSFFITTYHGVLRTRLGIPGVPVGGEELAMDLAVRARCRAPRRPDRRCRVGRRAVLFSTIDEGRLLRFDRDEKRERVRRYINRVNGLALGPGGELYGAQEGGRRLVEFVPDGRLVAVDALLDGKHHNQPSDLVVDRKHRIWFTDPHHPVIPFGPQIFPMLDHQSVLRFERNDRKAWTATRITFDTSSPRAVLLSPDQRTLYVADGEPREGQGRELRAYPVRADGSLGHPTSCTRSARTIAARTGGSRACASTPTATSSPRRLAAQWPRADDHGVRAERRGDRVPSAARRPAEQVLLRRPRSRRALCHHGARPALSRQGRPPRVRKRGDRETAHVARNGVWRLVLALVGLVGIAAASAQDYPNRFIRVIVGPGPDMVARLFGPRSPRCSGSRW